MLIEDSVNLLAKDMFDNNFTDKTLEEQVLYIPGPDDRTGNNEAPSNEPLIHNQSLSITENATMRQTCLATRNAAMPILTLENNHNFLVLNEENDIGNNNKTCVKRKRCCICGFKSRWHCQLCGFNLCDKIAQGRNGVQQNVISMSSK